MNYIPILFTLQGAVLVLNLAGQLDWSWWWVLAPALGAGAGFCLLFLTGFFYFLFKQIRGAK
jgi:hypothetical protein